MLGELPQLTTHDGRILGCQAISKEIQSDLVELDSALTSKSDGEAIKIMLRDLDIAIVRLPCVSFQSRFNLNMLRP